MARKADNKVLNDNLHVDYVISYRFTETSKLEAQKGLERLIEALARTGLQTSVRNGRNCSLLVFVKAPSPDYFQNELYKSRVKDWLYGLRAAQPDRETHNALNDSAPTEGERFRIVHHLITSPPQEGGAGIRPKSGDWKNVESIFPLHDNAFNKQWISKWSTETFLKPEDLDEIRDRFGEKIAFYFAFTQSYFTFLIFLAAFGLSAWVLLGPFSPIYAIVNTLWCVTFTEYWKRQEIDMGIRWGVRGVSEIQQKRHDFEHEKEVRDPITGETIQIFSSTKRLARQTLSIPFALLAMLGLGTLIATCFGIEIFLSEVYNGPFKSLLVYLPTVLLTTLVPVLTTFLTNIATKLNDFENYETTEGYKAALTAKIFILNFITSYFPVFLTAFVYVPFGSLIVPYLDVFHITARPFAENDAQLKVPKSGFQINPDRLQKQVIYFAITAQIVNFLLETVVPYVKRMGFREYQSYKAGQAAKKEGGDPGANMNDHSEESEFLTRVRDECELDVYDVDTDLREMVVQFGYLSLFSCVWPLVPVCYLVNNWVELRSDAVKIAVEMQRPTPFRADGIGPWLDSLTFLAWLGSITMAAIVYLFESGGVGPGGTPDSIRGWALLLTIFFSEHIYLVVRLVVRIVISKMDSPGMAKERAERFMVRKRYLQEHFGDNAMELPAGLGEKITRQSLEDDARAGSLQSSSPTDRFWARQKGWQESLQVGSSFIQKAAPAESKKQQ